MSQDAACPALLEAAAHPVRQKCQPALSRHQRDTSMPTVLGNAIQLRFWQLLTLSARSAGLPSQGCHLGCSLAIARPQGFKVLEAEVAELHSSRPCMHAHLLKKLRIQTLLQLEPCSSDAMMAASWCCLLERQLSLGCV